MVAIQGRMQTVGAVKKPIKALVVGSPILSPQELNSGDKINAYTPQALFLGSAQGRLPHREGHRVWDHLCRLLLAAGMRAHPSSPPLSSQCARRPRRGKEAAHACRGSGMRPDHACRVLQDARRNTGDMERWHPREGKLGNLVAVRAADPGVLAAGLHGNALQQLHHGPHAQRQRLLHHQQPDQVPPRRRPLRHCCSVYRLLHTAWLKWGRSY